MRDGLAPSRTRAEALIRAGRVLVDDVPVEKPGSRVRDTAAVRLRGELRNYVSRGGDKLAPALDAFGIEARDRVCVDVGSSTGGFTDVLLSRGARSVVAIDVGYGQLHPKLRDDPRVEVRERTNARYLEPGDLPPEATLVTVDVSFISARQILPALRASAPRAEVVVLVKPQFEIGREGLGKGGVVRGDEDRWRCLEAVARAAEELGYERAGAEDAALAGPKGNREIFLYLRPGT